MIVGIGVDIVDVDRVRTLLLRNGPRFRRKVFTDGEAAYCDARENRAPHFAARFAAKEATLKALGGAASSGIGWREMEVVSGPGRPPRIELHGRARAAAAKMGASRIHLSISHTARQAAAWVIAESSPAA